MRVTMWDASLLALLSLRKSSKECPEERWPACTAAGFFSLTRSSCSLLGLSCPSWSSCKGVGCTRARAAAGSTGSSCSSKQSPQSLSTASRGAAEFHCRAEASPQPAPFICVTRLCRCASACSLPAFYRGSSRGGKQCSLSAPLSLSLCSSMASSTADGLQTIATAQPTAGTHGTVKGKPGKEACCSSVAARCLQVAVPVAKAAHRGL